MLHDPPALAADDVLAAALPDLAVARLFAPLSGPWLAGDDADVPAFRLSRSAGAPCLWHPDRLATIAADLDAAASLIDRVEAASGWRFEPARCLDTPVEGAFLVAISDGQATLELALSGRSELPAQLRAAAQAAPVRGDRPRRVRLNLSGPVLPVEEVAALSTGDLLLLPAAAPVSIAGADFAPDLTLSLELETGTLRSAAWTPDPPGNVAFAVPVIVTLPAVTIAPDSLNRAREGEAVPLGPLIEGAEITLSVGGQALGAGTLTRLGSRFAVEIAAPAPLETPAP